MANVQKKLTIEEFITIRRKLIDLIEVIETELNKDNTPSQSDYIYKKYSELISELLACDLSDIPFEEWNGLRLDSLTDFLDFSQTHANIDFQYVTIYCPANLKGCKIANLNKHATGLNPEYFDEEVIKANSNLFLSDNFDKEFREKYNSRTITIADLSTLNEEQIAELQAKMDILCLQADLSDNYLLKVLGVEKTVKLYNISKDDYEYCLYFANISKRGFIFDNLLRELANEVNNKVKEANPENVKDIYKQYAQMIIQANSDYPIPIYDLPKEFVDQNKDFLLLNSEVPTDVKNRFYTRKLTAEDIIKYPEAFKDVLLQFFCHDYDIINIVKTFGGTNLQKVALKHPDVLRKIIDGSKMSSNPLGRFRKPSKEEVESLSFKEIINLQNSDFESRFYHFVRYLLRSTTSLSQFVKTTGQDGKVSYSLPSWVESMDFHVVEDVNSIEDLASFNDKTFLLDLNSFTLVETFGAQNLLRFDKETQFFSHQNTQFSSPLENFYNTGKYLKSCSFYFMSSIPNKEMTYEEFLDVFAKTIDHMRKWNQFTHHNYDFIEGKFREDHPELFIDKSAPQELKDAFYSGELTLTMLSEHPEYVEYLKDKNINSIVNVNCPSALVSRVAQENNPILSKRTRTNQVSLLEYYAGRFGITETLNLIVTYGKLLENIKEVEFYENSSKEEIKTALRNSIYQKVCESSNSLLYYFREDRLNEEMLAFKDQHPDIFISCDEIPIADEETRKRIYDELYSNKLTTASLRSHPELINVLKHKNLHVFLRQFHAQNYAEGMIKLNNFGVEKLHGVLDLVDVIGEEEFLKLCVDYGNYLFTIEPFINFIITVKNISGMRKIIESIITRVCLSGQAYYNETFIPTFLKEQHPELFLSADAPKELKDLYYYEGMKFEDLKAHPEWESYLLKAHPVAAFMKSGIYNNEALAEFFEKFNIEHALKLIISKPETVKEMINNQKVHVMAKWYHMTDYKFIPDSVVMLNMPIEEFDNFMANSRAWSLLMKDERFNKSRLGVNILFRLACVFGIFNNDKNGIKELNTLLHGIPRNMPASAKTNLYLIDEVHKSIEKEAQDIKYNNILESLREEGFELDPNKGIFKQLYRISEDGSLHLLISPQNYPKSIPLIRDLLVERNNPYTLTFDMFHHILGGLSPKYSKEFREFLTENLNYFLENGNKAALLQIIQSRFDEIRVYFSSRVMTMEAIETYLAENNYANLQPGNEELASTVGKEGYSQKDFEKLQQIYNHGRKRTFSSIPRVTGKKDEFTYEILKLDDPLAITVGNIATCCQVLGDYAELCMEHSVVSSHGRIFVVRDNEGNIVAQSWVWRNGNVICFDNIEVPNKQLIKHGIPRGKVETGMRNEFTDKIIAVYHEAAKRLIEKDEEEYKKLLEKGIITKEQYEHFRLGIVTTGLGYNNVADTIKSQYEHLKDNELAPLRFDPPVMLENALDIDDSREQYVLEQREEQHSGTPPIFYHDAFIEYTDDNVDQVHILTLQKLELMTEDSEKVLLEYDIDKTTDLISRAAYEFDLDPLQTKAIITPNFALVYDSIKDTVRVGALFYNSKLVIAEENHDITDILTEQIKLAIEQISQGKEIDSSRLEGMSSVMFNLAANTEIDLQKINQKTN